METARKFRTYFHSFADVLMFMRIYFFITALPLLVRFLTLSQLMGALTWRVSGFCRNRDDNAYREKIVRFTDYILKRDFWIYRNTCLKRSLVLYYFLLEVVPDIHICFGVRLKKDEAYQDRQKELDGHAWLIHNGEFFLESNPDITSTYAVTYCFPGDLLKQGTVRQGHCESISRK